MRIQCERCSTVYELDETRLPPGGASVQCMRCKHVFRAVPPGAAGETIIGLPPPPAPEPAPRPRQPASPGAGGRTALLAPESPGASGPERAGAAAEAERTGDTTITRQVAATRAARRRAWLIPVVLLVLAAIAASSWAWWRSRVDPRALALRAEGQARLARDDRGSLEQAAARFAASAAADPRYAPARADLALARLLLADDAASASRVLESAFRALEAERARVTTERPAGWQANEQALVERMKALQGEAEPLRERARLLREEAFAILKALAVSSADAEGTGRTLALYHALDGDVAQASRLALRPSGDAPRDPWGSLALATAAVRSREGQGREEAVRSLAELAAAHPELLRVRLTLAQGLAVGGQRDAAVRTLDQVLTENPAHERAKAYKAELLAPPPVALVPVPAPPGAPPPRPPGNLPRLKDGEAGKASASPAGGARPKGTKGGKGTKAKATKPRTGQGKAPAPPGGGTG